MSDKKIVRPSKKPVSIQGELGSFSHMAVNNLFGVETFLNTRQTFDEVFKDLKTKESDIAVIPIENSTYGSIYQNYDNITEHGCEIFAETYVKVEFQLLAQKGVSLKDVKRLHSHPVALGQIKGFLKDNKKIKPIEHKDTAGAAKMVSELEGAEAKETAAAASKLAAAIYRLEIIKKDIHQNSKNYTRFFAVKRAGEDISRYLKNAKSEKTTIQFELGEEPGSLYKSLRCFADRDIALTKIESRPVIETDWEYRFYVDVLAGEQDEKMKNAIKELTGYVKKLKILGSYARG